MNRMSQWLSALVIGLIATTGFAANLSQVSPIGYWKTIDDVTGKPKSIVQIWKADNEMLMGKVIKLYPSEGSRLTKVCNACDGNLHNKPIVGMVIISGLKASESAQWTHGQILDPENGKSYNLSLRTAENGKKLDVHGYLGFPILGKSQTWERVDLMSDR